LGILHGRLFTGAFGELRNPKAQGDPTKAEPLVSVEEMMTAGTLRASWRMREM
jgi:hypothetical protein